jgi:hypothetical protein
MGKRRRRRKRSYLLRVVATMPNTKEGTVVIVEGVHPLLPLTAMLL